MSPIVKTEIPHKATGHGNGGSNSGSFRDDYDNPEDLWEDNPDWYEDEDEAWDDWYDD